jgi:hypothetical protein
MDESIGQNSKVIELSVSSKGYFAKLVEEALGKRQLDPGPFVSDYLVQLLETNMLTQNMMVHSTFAEMLLRAQNAEKQLRQELLRKLGDTSLYISGFFGDSLRRKIVDIDYYANIGGIAYGSLSREVPDKNQALVFNQFADRFLDYVDVLTYVSQTSSMQSNQDLLRVYERYVITGSPLAKDQLIERGLLAPVDRKKVAQ